MQAIELYQNGPADDAFRFVERKTPVCGPNDVLIKVSMSGLNFADVMARRGLYQDCPPLPTVIGYDVVGVIEEVGAEAQRKYPELAIGQRVTALTRFNGYANYIVTTPDGVATIPDDMSDGVGTALAVQACTAVYCAEEAVTLHENDVVLVQAAAGGVGSALVQIAKAKGCTVIGTASTKKIDYLKEIGVDIAIDYTSSAFEQVIREQLGKRPLDVAFDSLGGQVYKKSMRLLKPSARMVAYGAAEIAQGDKSGKLRAARVVAQFGVLSPIMLMAKSQGVIGVNMLHVAEHRPTVFKKCLERCVHYFKEGILKPRVDSVYAAADIAQAHEQLESRRAFGKVVIQWPQ